MTITKVLRNKGDRSYHLRTTHQGNEYNVIVLHPSLGLMRTKIQHVTKKNGKEICKYVKSGEIITILTKEAIAFIKSN